LNCIAGCNRNEGAEWADLESSRISRHGKRLGL
jgi:hypothetical protein